MPHESSGSPSRPWPTFLLALWLLTLSSGRCDCVKINGTVRVMFLYATPISDAGWTYNLNRARLTAFQNLTSRYPSTEFAFDYVESFPLIPNRSAALEQYAASYDVIYSGAVSNYAPLSPISFANRFPQVLWVQLDSQRVFDATSGPPNLVYHAVDTWGLWFVAGAVTGAQLDPGAQACMVYALPLHRMVVNAFFQGMQFAGGLGSGLSAVCLQTFYDATLGPDVAQELVRRGCAIIAHFTDTPTIEQYVSSIQNGTFSIGYGGDSGSYIGDSVLTSVYFQLNAFMVQLVESVLLGRPPPPATVLRLTSEPDSPARVAPPSAKAKAAARSAFVAAESYISANRSSLFCGRYNFVNGTAFGGACVPDNELLKPYFDLLPAVQGLSDFVPPSNCSAGSIVSYRSSDLLFSCTRCPENTFSAAAGSRFCTPCAPGQEAGIGATVCQGIPSTPFWIWIIVAALCLLVATVAALGVRILLRPALPLTVPPPQGPEVTLIIVGIDCKRHSKWRHHILAICDLASELVTRCSSSSRVYVISAVSGVHLVAAETPGQAFAFADAVAQEAAAVKWPVDVTLRLALHCGRPQVVRSVDDSTARTRYVGRDLDVVREIFKQTDLGCWCSESTMSQAAPRDFQVVERRSILLPDGMLQSIASIRLCQANGTQPRVLSEFSAGPGHSPQPQDTESKSDARTRVGDLMDAEALVLTTLSIISADEFVAAHEFATDILRLFISVVPFSVAVSSLTTACLRLSVAPPRVPSEVPPRERALKLLQYPIAALSLHLLRQLEEMELVALMDKWNAAAQNRGPHRDDGSQSSRAESNMGDRQ